MSRIALSLNLVDLPKVFEGDNGEVNISLLKNICNIWPKSSSILRGLIEGITNERLKPKEDTYIRLSKLIHGSEFRNSWFSVRKTGFPTFDRLVLLYAMANNHHLTFDSPELAGFYEKRKNKSGKGTNRFPILKNIHLLTEQLCAPGADSYISALFAWGMIESCKISLVEHPNDSSLLSFEETLISHLTENKHHRILELLTTPKWKKDIVENVNSKAKSYDLVPHDDSLFQDLQTVGSTRHKHPLNSELSLDLFTIRDAILKIKALSEGMVQKASLLLNSPNTQVVINSIQEAVNIVSSLYEVIDEKRKHIVFLLYAPLKDGYAKLELPEPLPLSYAFSISSYAEWELKIESVEDDVAQRVEKINRILSRSPQTLRELVAYKKSEAVQASSDVLIDLLANAAVIIEYGLKAENDLAGKIEGNYRDLSWNPLADEQLQKDTWINLGALLLQRKSINSTMGICVRKEFSALLSGFVDLMISQFKVNSKENILNLVAAASWLTLGQKEEVARTNEKCIQIIALAQLQAYLNSSEVNHVERYSYWSSYPLNELSSNPTDLFGEFFSALYLCTIEQSSDIDIKFLTRQVAKALISNGEKRHSSSAETELRRSLCSILELHHKGGSNTYAHVWNAAYDDFFLPLYQIAIEGSLNDFVSLYNGIIANFEIEDHLTKWKQEIPEHLKKRSEYDKFIRNQVNIKISEINDWVALHSLSYSKASYKDNPRHEALIKKICCVLDADDADTDALKSWLLSLHENQKLAQRPCFEKSLEGAFEADFQCKDVSAFYPRAFIKMLNSGRAAHIDIVADAIILDMGFNTHSQLTRLYADHHLFEAFAAITSESNQEVAPSVERIVEKHLEELEAAQQGKIFLLSKRLQALSTPVDELTKNLHHAEELLKSHQWTKLEKELNYADQYILLEEADALEATEREILIARIIGLGGTFNPSDNVEALKNTLNVVLDSNKPRRLHIEQIAKFTKIKSMDEALSLAVSNCVLALDNRQPYPSAEVSELLAYYFQQAIDPLLLELSRIKTLLPSYSRKLKLLTINLLQNITSNERSLEEHSTLVSALIDTADMWKDLGVLGESCIDEILGVFDTKGLDAAGDVEVEVISAPESVEKNLVAIKDQGVLEDQSTISDRLDQLAKKAKSTPFDDSVNEKSNVNFAVLIEEKKWKEISARALKGFLNSPIEYSANWLEHLTDWSLSSILSRNCSLSVEEYSTSLYLINTIKSSSVVRAITPTKNVKGMIGEIAVDFISLLLNEALLEMDAENKSLSSEKIQYASTNVERLTQFSEDFSAAFSFKGTGETMTTRALWDYFSGDSRQAEARAAFMNIAWRLRSPAVTAACLIYAPIDMERRKAFALAEISNKALIEGNHELLQGFVDLRKSIHAKPFQLFVEMLMRRAPIHTEIPASLVMAGNLEFVSNGVLQGILNINPRKVDCPDHILITLSPTAPIRFKGGALKWELVGPFFSDTSRSIEFEQRDENAEQFRIEIDCIAISLTGINTKFSQILDLKIAGIAVFEPLTPDFIEEAFDSFPEQQMRGSDYIARTADEQKIEKALFKSKVVRSLWISSPRRSGKTSMLYRILDAFSHKMKRDNFVIYLTIDETFTSGFEFNRWIWKRLCSIPANKELRDLYADFDTIGKTLSFDADAGTFIGQLSDLLIENCPQANRVIFLIDEIDRFASMYFEGGSRKKLAADILWQIRYFIAERRDIGIVFAGSSAAREVFISNPESPFYNSIEHLELSPFSCKTKPQEASTRQIVEPGQIKHRHVIPKDSLEHLVWVCSGIPYYMKLVAGATFAVATQSHILVSDINAGLRALLSKNTNISKLDDMGGDPGADDLRTTITLERSSDGVLVRGVLYAVADLHSPVSGHRVLRGRVSSKESKLSLQYGLSKDSIERGIEICLKLGLLRLSASETTQELFFAIPILGESLRNSSARHWALIDHELNGLSATNLEGAKV